MALGLPRHLSPWEASFELQKSYVQLAFEATSPSEIPKIVKELSQDIIGLRVCHQDGKYHFKDRPPFACPIPNSINNMHDACYYSFNTYMPESYDACGVLSYNDKFCIATMKHALFDGGLACQVINSLFTDHERPKRIRSMEECLIDDLRRVHKGDGFPLYCVQHPLTFLKKRKDHLLELLTNGEPVVKWCQTVCTDFPAAEATNYSNGRIKRQTETLITGLVLPAIAMNGTFDSTFGCSSLVDMRRHDRNRLQHNPLESCNVVGEVAITIQTNLEETLGAVQAELKKEKKRAINSDDPYGLYGILSTHNYDALQHPDIFLELTNFGHLKMRDPVKNVMITCLEPTRHCQNSLYLIGYTKGYKDHSDCHLHLKYVQSVVSHKAAENYLNNIKRTMTQYPLTMKLKEIIADLKKYNQ